MGGAYNFNFDTDSSSRYQTGQSKGETRSLGKGIQASGRGGGSGRKM